MRPPPEIVQHPAIVLLATMNVYLPFVYRLTPRQLTMKTSKLCQLLAMAGCLVLLRAPGAGTGANRDLARQLNQAFVEVVETVSPAVVVLTVTQPPPRCSATRTTAGPQQHPVESFPSEFWRFHEQFENGLPQRTRAPASSSARMAIS